MLLIDKYLKNWPDNHIDGFLPLQRAELLILGAWPLKDAPYWFIALGIFNALFNGMCVIAEFTFALQNSTKLQLILDSLCPAFTKMCIAIKLLVFVWKRHKFYDVLKTLSTFYINKNNVEDIKISRKLAKTSFNICLILLVFAELTGFFFTIVPVSQNIYNILHDKEPVALLPFRSIWPWQTQTTPTYEITYILLAYSSWLTSTAVPGLDCTFMGICLHISAEFHSISTQLEKIGIDIDEKAPTFNMLSKNESNKTYKKLIKLIDKHNLTIELSDTARTLAQEMIFAHFLTSAMVICMNGVNLIIAPGAAKLIYVNYIMTGLIQAFVFCYGGDALQESVRLCDVFCIKMLLFFIYYKFL